MERIRAYRCRTDRHWSLCVLPSGSDDKLNLASGVFFLDRSSDKGLWGWLNRLRNGRLGGDDSLEQAVMEAREEGELDTTEGSMILSILKLDEVHVQDIMTPRTDFDCLPSGSPVIDVVRCILETGHSRLPIYQETRDNIIGIAYAKDLLSLLIEPGKQNTPVDSIMRPPFFVPETKIVSELLQEFRARKNHIAIAVDEFGGTSGLATIEDILEVIVGDIEDEHDAPKEEEIHAVGESRYEISGRATLEELREIGINLESDEVDTVGGYLCFEAGEVPAVGESFVFANWKFTIKEANLKQIQSVLAEPVVAGR